MRVLFLTLYPETMPSSRLRVYQYLPFLKAAGISFKVLPAVPEPWFSRLYFSKSKMLKALYCLVEAVLFFQRVKRVSDYDLVVVQKGLLSTHLRSFEQKLGQRAKRILYDLDDDVLGQLIVEFGSPALRRWQDKDQNKKLAGLSRKVIVGNHFLKEKVLPLNPQTVVLPTPVDAERFCPGDQNLKAASEVVIGWIGMEIGLGYLKKLAPVFERLSQRYALRVKVISRTQNTDAPFSLPGVKTQFVRWSYETEVREMRSFDIGVMPVIEDEWGPGKCGLKLLQYMSMGLASVASRVGANRDIVEEDTDAFLAGSEAEWEDKLARLIESAELRNKMGQAARKKVQSRYSLQALAPKWVSCLTETALRDSLGQPESSSIVSPVMPQNILRVTYILPQMDMGGAETHVVRLAEGLRKRGHDARILCVFGEGKLAERIREKGIPLEALGQKKWGLAVLGPVKKYLEKNPCQIVHTYLFGLHFFAGLPARLTRVEKVLSSRRDVELSQPAKVLWLEKMGNFFCDHVTACSQAVESWVLGRENLKKDKITTLYNGVDLHEFVPGQGRAVIRKEFSIHPEALVVGTVANFSLKKGYAYLLEAAERVLSARPDCYFLLVGSGPLEQEMKERAARMPLGDRILFAGARKDVSNLLAAMDIFAFTSLWEGLPNVVLEAMAMRLPVISTPAGGVPEVIIDGIEGRLIPFRDSAAAADVILQLAGDSGLRERLGKAARQKIEMDFSLERMVCEYENFYQGLLHSKVSLPAEESTQPVNASTAGGF